ncbi:hypothetical protein A2715_05900 [Candidatus Woesebacteria bacterium RIFCSPHIGHO2_01_FULL_39_32]|uniref:DUF11 domain-containing protein n=1 Tax=Candidatus Woesebacteria bacterium RIFCSPLOWO2_01_FULL_39_25 TaxID=1802521 RepID=A0A1F8BLX3_9BACT|nr:MAG: hypothetical protein A2715_05900 [Candidatus Woesebacteria bacterium RIFCSPHIGHO2_01_FULL_39_32]OGM36830.1 MAG: hypothetical protein A3F01_00375 [Candidatus Woesebacteria bacterium RIFCSPHIGHO2_12_FULL_38_11]OGM65081.1 MAG: hypothetical protein A2893_05510 [Candidatus Woesebacteria bacterium RIFCSPLOWO2_01_FULL_39_25]
MIKRIFISALFLLVISSYNNIFAADKNVVCNNSGCSGFSGSLFSESGMLPGDTLSKTFSVKNERNEPISLTLESEENAGTDEIFKQKIVAVVYENGGLIKFSGTFENFLVSDIALGNLSPNETKNYEISISFPTDAGNEYQGKVINFDLSITITGDDGSTEVLSSSTSNTNSSSNNSSRPGSILGTILGLSDTGGVKLVLIFGGIGILLTSIGLKLIHSNRRG